MRPGRMKRYEKCVKQSADYPYRIEKFNCDMHWRLTINGTAVDFWPHTGKYRTPDGRIVGVAADFNDFTQRIDEALAQPMVTK